MASVASIGAVVRVGERRYVVVGHRMTREGDAVGLGYVVVPYPLGFVSADSISLVLADRVGEVVADGLTDEAGAAHLTQLEELVRANAGIPYEEYEASARLLRDFAREGAVDA